MNFDRNGLLALLDDFVETLLTCGNKDGSFREFKPVNSQYPVYTLAILYENKDSRYYRDTEIKKTILSALRNRLKNMDPEGKLIFFSDSGENLGYFNSDWTHFILLEMIYQFKDLIPAKLASDLSDRLKLALSEHFKDAKKKLSALRRSNGGQVHNLLVWESLLLYRAGMLMPNSEWKKLASDAMDFFINKQSEEGWWSEGGPITVYNWVTAMAVSLYYEWSGSEKAEKSVERSLKYHMSTTYPDMRNIETIDGRVRYSDSGIGPYFPPSFARYTAGAEFLNDLIKASRGNMTKEKIQLFSFLGHTFNYACRHQPAGNK